jgi:two-component system, NtrC family, sensor kinase
MNGFELCRRLKSDPATAHVPVALVTGRIEDIDVEEGISAGAVDYIKKPFDRAEVRMRVRAQIRLHETWLAQAQVEAELAAIASAAGDAIVLMDKEGSVVHWNPAAEAMFGHARQDAVGRNVHTLIIPPRFRDALLSGVSELLRADRGAAIGRTVELVALRKNGDEFPIELTLTGTRIDDRWHAIAIIRDITEQAAAKAALQSSEARLQSILEKISVGIAIVGMDRTIRWTNRAAMELVGVIDPAGLSAQPCHQYFCTSPPGQCPILDRGQTVERAERVLRRPDGRQIPILTSAYEIEFGGERALLETFVDLTERKRMEAELGHARKLEAVGQLAAGIAHEINTPAQFVGDSLHFLRNAFDDVQPLLAAYRRAVDALQSSPVQEAIIAEVREAEEEADLEYLAEHMPKSFERCFDGISRISSIVGAMKEFAHPGQREKSQVDLNRALQSTLVIARNEYKYVADVDTELGVLPPVTCHVGDLNQVFLNLIVNAAHAIAEVVGSSGERGRITVHTAADGDRVRVEIADTGCGIPEDIRERIFDPFFTTKPVGKGSGQGLAIARSVVVDKHGGTLTCRSEVGTGTTFTICIPVDGA